MTKGLTVSYILSNIERDNVRGVDVLGMVYDKMYKQLLEKAGLSDIPHQLKIEYKKRVKVMGGWKYTMVLREKTQSELDMS